MGRPQPGGGETGVVLRPEGPLAGCLEGVDRLVCGLLAGVERGACRAPTGGFSLVGALRERVACRGAPGLARVADGVDAGVVDVICGRVTTGRGRRAGGRTTTAVVAERLVEGVVRLVQRIVDLVVGVVRDRFDDHEVAERQNRDADEAIYEHRLGASPTKNDHSWSFPFRSVLKLSSRRPRGSARRSPRGRP